MEAKEKDTVWYSKLCAIVLAALLAVNVALAAVLIPVALRMKTKVDEALVSVQNMEESFTDTADEAVKILGDLGNALEELDLSGFNSVLSDINKVSDGLSDAIGALEKVVNALKLINIFK